MIRIMIWKEAIVTCLRYYSGFGLERPRNITEKVRIADLRVEI
jgi:hypothetical protein